MNAEGAYDGYSAVLAEADADRDAAAMAVADGVYARATIADRFRHALGVTVALHTRACGMDDEPIAGAVAAVSSDAVLIHRPGAAFGWIVMLHSLESAAGLPAGHRRAAGAAQEAWSARSMLRRAADCDVVVALGGRRTAGRLERVGADHVQVSSAAGSAIVPLAAIGWVKVPIEPQLESSVSGLSRT